MAKTKISQAVEEKSGKNKEETGKIKEPGKKADVPAKEGIKEPIAKEAQEEIQGAEGKSPDQMIEENLIILMNLDHEKLDNKALAKAIAHLALTVLVLKKTMDKIISQVGQHNQDIGTLAQEHQAAQQQNQQSMLDLHNRIGTMAGTKSKQAPVQQAPAIMPQ